MTPQETALGLKLPRESTRESTRDSTRESTMVKNKHSRFLDVIKIRQFMKYVFF